VSNKLVMCIVALIAVVACSGPSAATTQSPSSVTATAAASPTSSTAVATQAAKPTTAAVETPSAFTSPIYRYTLTLPAGWRAGAAALRWDGASQPGYEEPVVDKFGGPVSASAFAFAGPVTFDLDGFVQDRIKANARDHGDTCPATPEVKEPIEIGGQPGVFLAWNCGILINQAVTVHDGVGFAMTMRDRELQAATNPDDRAILEALLGSVIFPN
jgi:hypothetical protein